MTSLESREKQLNFGKFFHMVKKQKIMKENAQMETTSWMDGLYLVSMTVWPRPNG